MTKPIADTIAKHGSEYSNTALAAVVEDLIRQQLKPEAWSWLQDKVNAIQQPPAFNGTFAAIPRKTGKGVVATTVAREKEIGALLPGFTIRSWGIDRLSRVWLLMKLDSTDKQNYFHNIETLYLTAEMNELVALYSALPVLAYPESWISRCAEGIRSNIADVLQAIMYENPYPAKYLPEPAWNQLILKAFFTEKDLHRIIGADERSNPELAHILSDYAHERWAAHRPVHPQLWRFVARHVDNRIFPDIQKIAASPDLNERKAAALVCRQSDYPPAKKLLEENEELQQLAAGLDDWKF